MKSIVKIISPLVLVCISGCITESVRDSSVAKVKNLGPNISTHQRYSLVCGYHGEGTQAIETNWKFLSEHQPNVFRSEGGIPIVLRARLKNADFSSGYGSFLLSLFSLQIIPHTQKQEAIYECLIEIGDLENVHTPFEILNIGDRAQSHLFPSPLLWYTDPPDVEGYCVFSQHTQTMTMTYPSVSEIYNQNKGVLGDGHKAYGSAYVSLKGADFSSGLEQRSLAYGLAVKLKELEDSGKIDAMLKKKTADVSTAPKHNIIRLDRDSDKNFSYFFELELAQNPTDFKKAWQMVMQDFAKSLKEDYRDAFPSADMASLKVSFSGFKRNGLRLNGSAAVLTLKPVSLEYNSHNRKGTMSVRFAEGQVSEASTWIRRNVKTLVRDKNIALTSGSLPSEGKFEITNEKIDGNVMTIEFMVE